MLRLPGRVPNGIQNVLVRPFPFPLRWREDTEVPVVAAVHEHAHEDLAPLAFLTKARRHAEVDAGPRRSVVVLNDPHARSLAAGGAGLDSSLEAEELLPSGGADLADTASSRSLPTNSTARLPVPERKGGIDPRRPSRRHHRREQRNEEHHEQHRAENQRIVGRRLE